MLRGDLLAKRLYELFGPCSITLAVGHDPEFLSGLRKRGFQVRAHGEKAYLRLDIVDADSDQTLSAPPAETRYQAFYCDAAVRTDRAELDRKCFASGLRRAPISASADPWGLRHSHEAWWAVYETSDGSEPHPVDAMTLDIYARASAVIRPGDRVLVVGSSPDGTHFLRALSDTSDICSYPPMEADKLFDVVVDVEHRTIVETSAVAASLVPAGLLITARASVWESEHLNRSSVVRLGSGSPGLSDVELTTFRKPYLVADSRFENRADVHGSRPGTGLDFKRYYVFPHVIQAITSKRYRTPDSERLRVECAAVLEAVSMNSADAGAALCVLSYSSPELTFARDDQRVSAYLEASASNPHVIRWQISLAYVRGVSLMIAGEHSASITSFEKCLSFPAHAFHPSIMTKQVGACIKAAEMCVAAGDCSKAAEFLKEGADLGRSICGADADHVFGPENDPRFFYFGEMAEVLTLASRCAYAWEQWRRSGDHGLRMALASSIDLFRTPRSADLRDVELQRQIIERQQKWMTLARNSTPELSSIEAFALESMTARAFLKMSVRVLIRKAVSRFQNMIARHRT